MNETINQSLRPKTCHDGVQAREGNEVHCHLPEIGIKLAWTVQACRYTAHCYAHEVIQVTVGQRCQLQRAEADVIQCLVVQKEALVSVFPQAHGTIAPHPSRGKCPTLRQRSDRIVCLDGPRSQTPRRTETPAQSLSFSWHIGPRNEYRRHGTINQSSINQPINHYTINQSINQSLHNQSGGLDQTWHRGRSGLGRPKRDTRSVNNYLFAALFLYSCSCI